MSVAVVWIDQLHAKLFQITPEKMERKHLDSRYLDHHTHSLDRLDVERQNAKFFGRVADELTAATQVLILGPGVGKHQFQNHLFEHYPLVAKRVAGCETVDHPSDGQIAALARQFFKLGLGQSSA